jgi:hypothetical protein
MLLVAGRAVGSPADDDEKKFLTASIKYIKTNPHDQPGVKFPVPQLEAAALKAGQIGAIAAVDAYRFASFCDISLPGRHGVSARIRLSATRLRAQDTPSCARQPEPFCRVLIWVWPTTICDPQYHSKTPIGETEDLEKQKSKECLVPTCQLQEESDWSCRAGHSAKNDNRAHVQAHKNERTFCEVDNLRCRRRIQRG